MADEAKLHSQIFQLLKHSFCDVCWGVVVENWALSVDQYQPQALQFSVHLLDLLNILHRGNGFSWIQKAVVDQTGSRPPDSGLHIFSSSLALGSALELLLGPTTELVIAGCHIKSTFHHRSQSD